MNDQERVENLLREISPTLGGEPLENVVTLALLMLRICLRDTGVSDLAAIITRGLMRFDDANDRRLH